LGARGVAHLVGRITVARAVVAAGSRRCSCVLFALMAITPSIALAQGDSCRALCDVEWKVEPTFTIENLANRHRVVTPDGVTERVNRERVFEVVFAVDMATKAPWLGFTAETITSPFSDDNVVELEFEANFHWLFESMTRGWVTSHFDVVDQLSPAERPGTERAYTHKLDFELDTALHVFKWLPEERWLRGVEFETSLDYLAAGLPKKGDVFPDGSRYLDDASRWSFSFVFVIPVAPF
jgi:hypothetical protein